MCRIAGIIAQHHNLASTSAKVKKMCAVMAHGGPDGEGFYENTEDHVVFGHRRLALLDLSNRGHQPMVYNDEYVISFNGEIYNYLLLKKELQDLGFQFKNQTDTEVILIGFAYWGISIFDRLSGMFAFALYDKITAVTYLVRDQSGIKPLYYSTTSQQLIFASEVKAFKQLEHEENPNWKTYFLAFGHIPEPFTTLKEVFSLPSGHYLKWDHKEQTAQIKSFTSLSTQKTITHKTEATASIRESLSNAVKNHLIADATIGVFLSGGLDSSILTLLADEAIGKNLRTVSINFTEEAFSEEKFQKLVTEKTAGIHNSCLVTNDDFNQNFQALVEAMDQPTNDGINSWFVNKCAKESGLKAVLSGIGADELYGGYPSFKRMGLINFLKKLPKFVLRLTAYLPSERLSRIYYLSYKNPIGEYLFLRGFFAPQSIAKILNISKHEIDVLLRDFQLKVGVANLQGEERVSWFETNLYMQNQLLKDTDFMSMSHGVEVRVPFLATDFVALTNSITNEIRFQKNPKGLLIDSFTKILPHAIVERPKMGFSFPLQKWFMDGGQITKEEIYRESAKAKDLILKFKKGKLHWSKAFALYQVSIKK